MIHNMNQSESIRSTKYHVPCTKTQEAEFRSKCESLLGTLYLVHSLPTAGRYNSLPNGCIPTKQSHADHKLMRLVG